MGDFIPKTKGGYSEWLNNLNTELPTEGPKFGLAAGDINAVTTQITTQMGLADAAVAAKSTYDAAIVAEATGRTQTDAFLRERISNWKTLTTFTPENAQKLRLVATNGGFDPATYKPEFTVRIVGGEIRLDWKKKGAQAVNVYSRLRGQNGWTKIGMDTSSPYIDGRPLAQANVPETREYMLRGLQHDDEIGLDSDVLNVTWGG